MIFFKLLINHTLLLLIFIRCQSIELTTKDQQQSCNNIKHIYHTSFLKMKIGKMQNLKDTYYLQNLVELYAYYFKQIKSHKIIETHKELYHYFSPIQNQKIIINEFTNLRSLKNSNDLKRRFFIRPHDKFILLNCNEILKLNRKWLINLPKNFKSKLNNYPVKFEAKKYSKYEYKFLNLFVRQVKLLHFLEIKLIFDNNFFSFINKPFNKEIYEILTMKSLDKSKGFIQRKQNVTEVTFYNVLIRHDLINCFFQNKYMIFYLKNSRKYKFYFYITYAKLFKIKLTKKILYILNKYHGDINEYYFYKIKILENTINSIRKNNSLKYIKKIKNLLTYNSYLNFEIKIKSKWALHYSAFDKPDFWNYYKEYGDK